MLKIDLRSDTVTRPDEGMRQAMARAEVGDDVFGEDPTVNRLQERAADLLGKQAALFVASGTMANQICLRILTQPGDEVICDKAAHLYRNEGGSGAVLSGLSFLPLPGIRGLLTPEMVASALQPDNVHYPVSRVVALENTHNRGNGSVYSLASIRAIAEISRKNGLLLHLDGARMFNACLSGGYGAREMAGHFDTVSFCLSKGLGAPVGSLVVSSKQMIKQALRVRKRMGGGWRQAGILAAAGLYALDNNLKRLAEDHDRAKRLALGLAELPGVNLNPDEIESNIVIFDITPSGLSPAQAVGRLAELGVGVAPFGGNNLRAVTHLQICERDIDEALQAFRAVFGQR
jgi:threonine aldolase